MLALLILGHAGTPGEHVLDCPIIENDPNDRKPQYELVEQDLVPLHGPRFESIPIPRWEQTERLAFLYSRSLSTEPIGGDWFVELTEHNFLSGHDRTFHVAQASASLMRPGVLEFRFVIPEEARTSESSWTFRLWTHIDGETRKKNLGTLKPGPVTGPSRASQVPKVVSAQWKGVYPEGNPLDDLVSPVLPAQEGEE